VPFCSHTMPYGSLPLAVHLERVAKCSFVQHDLKLFTLSSPFHASRLVPLALMLSNGCPCRHGDPRRAVLPQLCAQHLHPPGCARRRRRPHGAHRRCTVRSTRGRPRRVVDAHVRRTEQRWSQGETQFRGGTATRRSLFAPTKYHVVSYACSLLGCFSHPPRPPLCGIFSVLTLRWGGGCPCDAPRLPRPGIEGERVRGKRC